MIPGIPVCIVVSGDTFAIRNFDTAQFSFPTQGFFLPRPRMMNSSQLCHRYFSSLCGTVILVSLRPNGTNILIPNSRSPVRGLRGARLILPATMPCLIEGNLLYSVCRVIALRVTIIPLDPRHVTEVIFFSPSVAYRVSFYVSPHDLTHL